MAGVPLTTDAGTRPRLPLRSKLLYTVGYFGVSLLSGLFLLWANYRYGALFTGPGKAYVGLALLVAHLINAPFDPVVGWWSDRTCTRFGRRKPFIAWGTVPLIVAFALLWAPPGRIDSLWNVAWLLGIASGFFALFSLVVNPYLAMLPDIARSNEDRVSTSALLATFGLSAEVVAMVGGSLIAGKLGFLAAVSVVSATALVCLICPLLVRERASGPIGEEAPPPRELGLFRAVRVTLANRPFRIFLLAKCLYWLGTRTIMAMVPFFVVGVLRAPAGQVELQSGLLVAWAVGPAFLWFAVLRRLARRFSKRQLTLAGLACLALGSGLMVTVGTVPIDPMLYARAIVAACAFAIAAVFAVPNAILADLVDLDARLTGSRREAMYFGAQGFFVKASWGGASALVMGLQGACHQYPALAARLSWVAILVTALLAFVVFRRFPEDRELRPRDEGAGATGSGTARCSCTSRRRRRGRSPRSSRRPVRRRPAAQPRRSRRQRCR